nr:arginine-glutamic acid dipeptide repeats protein [Ciona intestinalis]|eukprot:XP_026692012.1 arginine-glutamic acid dipeptide repeats protein [Ciona intestinalis]
MDTTAASKTDSIWMQGTRRNTRSSSNQDKEAKEKETNEVLDSKKKEEGGHIVRGPNNEVVEYTTSDDVSYKVMDSAYIATERADNPYFIATIQELKVSKKDNAVVVVKWYYRPSEVPDSVYQMLVKDRLEAIEDSKEREQILNEENRNRELFACDEDLTDVFPVSSLRGKCSILHFKRYNEVVGYDMKPDTFFYVLGYNPDTRRLTSTQGEVRVGPSHQWNASTRGIFQKATLPDILPAADREYKKEYEEKIWEPNVNECDLIMYLRSARSMAAFAGMCDGGSPEEGCIIASRDDTTINALNVLFQNKGDARVALQVLVKSPLPLTIERKWTEDQVKRFQKGLRQNGKNFYKIRKDLLPNMQTADLVEFYYLWKKVQENLMIQPQNKSRRQAALRRNPKNAPVVETGGETSSELESETDDDETRKKVCHHCQTTTSDDWSVYGSEGLRLCMECLVSFKKYGHNKRVDVNFDNSLSIEEMEEDPATPMSPMFMESVAKVPPPFMFKPIKEKLSEDHQPSINTKSSKRQWKMNGVDAGDQHEDVKRIKPEIKTEDVKSTLTWNTGDPSDKNKTSESENQSASDNLKESTETKLATNQPQDLTQSTRQQQPTQFHTQQPNESKALVLNHQNDKAGHTDLKNGDKTKIIQLQNDQSLLKTQKLPMQNLPTSASSTTSAYTKIHQSSEQDKPSEVQCKMEVNSPYKGTPVSQADFGTPPVLGSPMDHIPTPDGHHFHSDGAMGQALLPSGSRNISPTPAARTQSLYRQSSPLPTAVNNQPKPSSFNPPHPEINPDEEEEEEYLPPQHHITIPAGESLPPSFRYDHGNHRQLPSSPETILFGKKTKFAFYPNSVCSRTDYIWIPPKDVKVSPKLVKHPEPHSSGGFQHPQQQRTPQHRPSHDRDREHPRPAKFHEPNSAKREDPHAHTPRPTSSVQSVPRSSPCTSTPYEPHSRPAPSHSSYAALGPGTPALRTLRQYAGTYDAQRDAMSAMPLYPYSGQHAGRELRERELREREMRERLPKPGLENLKLLESLDHLSTSHHGVTIPPGHPSAVQSLNPQVIEQLRQAYPPGAVVGMPATSPQIPGFSPIIHPDFSAHQAANERISSERLAAIEQYRMELLHSHQHSHIHSHLHLHQPNAGAGPMPLNMVHPPGGVNEAMLHPYAVMALQAQSQQALASGLDPLHAASVTNQMLSLQGFRGPTPIMPNPAMPVPQPTMPGRPIDPLQQYLSATHHLQAVAHEQQLMEHRAALQEEYIRAMAMGHKP